MIYCIQIRINRSLAVVLITRFCLADVSSSVLRMTLRLKHSYDLKLKPAKRNIGFSKMLCIRQVNEKKKLLLQ